MILRTLTEVFYFVPAFCGWLDENDDDKMVICVAWLCWSLELKFQGCY